MPMFMRAARLSVIMYFPIIETVGLFMAFSLGAMTGSPPKEL